MRIVVVDENAARSAIIESGLREAGDDDIVRLSEKAALLKRLEALEPYVVLIDLANPNRDSLEAMLTVSRTVRRPVAMFVDQSDAAKIQAAVDAGVSAYIVDGLAKERVKAILDMAVSTGVKPANRSETNIQKGVREGGSRRLPPRRVLPADRSPRAERGRGHPSLASRPPTRCRRAPVRWRSP